MKAQRVLLLMVVASTIYAQCLAQTTIGRQKVDQFTTTAWGTQTYGLTWLPDDYNTTTTKYPLVIFFHGSGEGGDGISGLNNLVSQGLPYLIAQGMNPEADNPIDGKHYKFIVISPQAPSSWHWSYSWQYLQYMLPEMLSRYRVDVSRIYVTGLSAGGAGTWSCVTNGPDAAKNFAAIVPVSAAGTNTPSEAAQLPLVGGTYGVKVWSTCGANDSFNSWMLNATNTINTASPSPTVPAVATSISGAGHDPSAWNTSYMLTWRSNGQNLNVFEWMLKWQRATNTPSADAGTNKTITLPTNQVILTGSGTATAGNSITGYTWTKISGPLTFTIASPSSASTNITNLVQGTYVFRLTVTDNNGATAIADVTVTVNPVPNVLPTANAGSDLTITLPVSSITLNGSGNDADGTISTYSWSKISGPSQYSIISPFSAQTVVNNLAQGTYQFQLTVTDNSGGTATDIVVVTVNATPNTPPTANAGADAAVTLPINSITLNGTGNDTDGTIASYQWTAIKGPATYTIVSPNQAQTLINNLVQGVYQFQLTVKDNLSAIGKDTVVITVNPTPNIPPVANAGTDQTITLPVNTISLNGSGTDSDGNIASYLWTKISGPSSFTIVSPNQAQTNIDNLIQGIYQFVLKVTDNFEVSAQDTVTVTVNAASNVFPIVNAGTDIIITLPKDSTILSGSASDADGNISSYQWTKISGPVQYLLVSASQGQTAVKNLVQGTYQFELAVLDNNDAVSKDTVIVVVNSANPQANSLPAAKAGTDQVITLPTDSTQLIGSGIDTDGTIVSYLWKKITGPSTYTIANSSQATTFVRNLIQGSYQFELTIADDKGDTGKDTVLVTVNPHVNKAPIVNTGKDTVITLPANSVTLAGNVVDSDGTISSYSWNRVSGPIQYNIASPTQAQTVVGNLMQGTYQFELTATDNDGATGRDTITVIVNSAATVSCNGVKRYMVPGGDGGRYMNGNPASTIWYKPVNPGDTLVLSAKHSWSYFSIESYSGTADCPIVIQNEGGQVWMTAGIGITSCKYVKVAGDGDPNTYYGFRVYNPAQDANGIGVSIVGKSRVVEVGRVDVYKKTYGVWAKQDPQCDESFNYPNFIMDSIEIHHCQFKNIGQDCIYAGNTDPLGKREYTCNGVVKNFIPMRLSNINIHHLIIDSCNRTGIQLSGANSGYNQIHDNVITRCGYEYNQYQGTGISIGGMTRNCHVYNNVIKNTFLYGILSFGVGTNYIENNVIDSAGWLDGAPNTVSRPSNILASPKETIPFDSTRIIIRNNKLGLSATTDDTNIGVVVWGPPTWANGNVLCSNTKLNGTTPAKVYVDPTINVINDCSKGLPNIPPSAFAGKDIVVNPIGDTALSGTASDADGTIISYSWTKVSGPDQFTIHAPDRLATTISNLVPGIYVFRLTVMDNDSLTAIDDIQVSVAPPNTAPVANAGPNQIITLPLNTVIMAGSGSDIDGTISSYQWTKISGPDSFVIVNANNPLTQINNLVQGTYLFELVVTDNNGAQDKDTVSLKVNAEPPPSNIPPVANAGSDMTITLPTNFAALNGGGNDPDGSISSYQWTKISGPSNYIFSNAIQAQTSVGNLDAGVYQFELRVVDNVGAIGRDTVTVTVNVKPNSLPLINAGADQTITLPVNTTMLNGAGMDADGSIINFTWTKISGPSQYTIVTSNQVKTTINGLVQGVYQFELMALDNDGAIGRDTVTVTVNPVMNIPPVANAGADQTIALPVTDALINGNGIDADGTIVSYQWTKIGGPASYAIGNTASAQTYIHNLVVGAYQFELTVTDNLGAIGKDTITIAVNPSSNVPPITNAGNNQNITLPMNSITLKGSATDADGSITGYSWSRISGPEQFVIASPAQAQTAINGLVEGTYKFELKVTDNNGAIGRDTVTVVVNHATATVSTASLYPNPASSTINIQITAVTHRNQTAIKIYDMSGVQVYKEEYLRTQPVEVRTIDITKLLAGTYIVIVGADINSEVTLKFIKQ